MGGAYTAQPAAADEEAERPDGWPEHWPFPGPNPPGHDPVYGITFISPPTPDEVSIGEEITVRVKMYEEGAGAPPPPELGTIAPDENIEWEAYVDEILIAYESTGWSYISGSYYSAWTFTPPLIPSDITEPPTLLTIDASGVMNNGNISQEVEASDTIEIKTPSLDINVRTFGGMTSGGLMKAAIYIYEFDSDSNLIFYATWGGTYTESTGQLVTGETVYLGELPEGLTYEITSDGTYVNLDLTWPTIEDDKRYIIDAIASGYNGNPTGIFSGTLSNGSLKTDTVISGINWLEGQLEVLPESDEVTWLTTWKDGVGGWPSPW